jgi:nucleoside-diphosphate-sugar epimerase
MADPACTERFLVTGSEGCIGSWVVRKLVERAVPVVACDIAPESLRLRRILSPELLDRCVYVVSDLTVPGSLEQVVAEHEITRIVHLAALQVPFVAADPLRGAEVNVVGTLRLLEAARRSSTVVGVSYASSSAVFGSTGGWGRPDTLYGVFKTANEESARFYARDYSTPSTGLRPCVVYGPNRDQGLSAAVTHALKAAVLGVPYTIPFHGLVDLQYVEDVAAAFIRVTMDDHDDARVFDLHGDLVDVADVIANVEQVVPESAGLISAGPAPVPGRVEFDDAELRAVVGELPKTSLADGIRASVELFRRQIDTGVLTLSEFQRATAPS